MSETYICDACGERIESGHTVAWAETLAKSSTGISWSSDNEVRHLCNDCWPDENETLTERLKTWLWPGGDA